MFLKLFRKIDQEGTHPCISKVVITNCIPAVLIAHWFMRAGSIKPSSGNVLRESLNTDDATTTLLPAVWALPDRPPDGLPLTGKTTCTVFQPFSSVITSIMTRRWGYGHSLALASKPDACQAGLFSCSCLLKCF